MDERSGRKFGSTVTSIWRVTARYMAGSSFDIVADHIQKADSEPIGGPAEWYTSCSVAILVSTQFQTRAPPPAPKCCPRLACGGPSATIFARRMYAARVVLADLSKRLSTRPVKERCQMTSIADRIAGPPLAGAAEATAPDVAAVSAKSKPAISFPAAGERELRLDLFRGLALWLIFIDHLPPNLLTWFTIRNYGFSDATEIFIFISGYTAAFVYGRAMLRGRLRGGDRAHPAAGLADLCRPRVPVHDLPRGNFLRRHQLREPAVHAKKWESWIFSSSRTSPSSRRCC